MFCVVLFIVCVYMCTVLLPPGGYPIVVKYNIYHITFLITVNGVFFVLFLSRRNFLILFAIISDFENFNERLFGVVFVTIILYIGL